MGSYYRASPSRVFTTVQEGRNEPFDFSDEEIDAQMTQDADCGPRIQTQALRTECNQIMTHAFICLMALEQKL